MRFEIKKGEFPGLTKKDIEECFFRYPLAFERWLGGLSPNEQVVLWFVARRLLGWGKVEDSISISQFEHGVGQNKGLGISESAIRRALDKLEYYGFIEIKRRKFGVNIYRLKLVEDTGSENKEATDGGVNISEDIRRLIEMFRAINPTHADKFLRDKRQIGAMERTVEAYGLIETEWLISSLKHVKGEYAPTITSPLELENKAAKLVMFIKRKDGFPVFLVNMDVGIKKAGHKNMNVKLGLPIQGVA